MERSDTARFVAPPRNANLEAPPPRSGAGARLRKPQLLRVYIVILVVGALVFSWAQPGAADELTDLLDRVEALNLRRGDYTLGKALTEKQKTLARRSAEGNSAPGTYKFRDGDLFIVAHESSDRIIILYRHWDPADRELVKKITGALILDFGDPTVFAHDKIIYWVHTDAGKLSQETYRKAKEKKTAPKVLATVKLSSSMKIMGEQEEGNAPGSVYFIISSEPVLKSIHSNTSTPKEASP